MPLTEEEKAIRIRIRMHVIETERSRGQQTPDWWDRDCRCCMMVNTSINFSQRAMKGVVSYLVIEGEEVHDWHTNDELLRFIDLYRERMRNA